MARARETVSTTRADESSVSCEGELCEESDDALDALLAAIVARAAQLRNTVALSLEDAELARTEGWIHLPKGDAVTGWS